MGIVPLMVGAEVQIVGGGLAGMLVAARLVYAGKEVHLHDLPSPSNASQVAAGLYNIYTGKTLQRTWQAERLLAELDALFDLPLMAQLIGYRHRINLYRPYPDAGTANNWAAQSATFGYEQLQLVSQPWQAEVLHNPLGGILIQGLGWIDVPGLLTALRLQLEATGLFYYTTRAFNYHYVVPDGPLTYIFCEGIATNVNPFRPFRPIQPLKGELLQVHLPGVELDRVVMAGVYVIPQSDGSCVAGATYDKAGTDAQPTEAGLDFLLARLSTLFPTTTPVVLAHRVALRPTSPDRKPILGRHPSHRNLWFLNGLGTKGVLYGPWCSRLLTEAVLTEDTSGIPVEIESKRKSLSLD